MTNQRTLRAKPHLGRRIAAILLCVMMVFTNMPSEFVSAVSEALAKESFNRSQTIDGITIHVKADYGVFPENATLKVEKIADSADKKQVKEAIQKELAKNTYCQQEYDFDISILDEDGKEVEPDRSKGEVKVSFEHVDTTLVESNSSDSSVSVYHVADNRKSATVLDEKNVTTKKDKVTFEAEHFSLYSVVITGNEKEQQYVVTTETEVRQMLKDLINTEEVPDTITDDTEINSVVSSDTIVLSVSDSGSDMTITPKKEGTSVLSIIYNTDITFKINVTVRNAVYLNPSSGDDGNNGESASKEGSSVGPLKLGARQCRNLLLTESLRELYIPLAVQ